MILAVVTIIYFDISQIGIFPGNLFKQTNGGETEMLA